MPPDAVWATPEARSPVPYEMPAFSPTPAAFCISAPAASMSVHLGSAPSMASTVRPSAPRRSSAVWVALFAVGVVLGIGFGRSRVAARVPAQPAREVAQASAPPVAMTAVPAAALASAVADARVEPEENHPMLLRTEVPRRQGSKMRRSKGANVEAAPANEDDDDALEEAKAWLLKSRGERSLGEAGAR
jgi:hypothetical protein